jgi:hypothetical protein
MEEAETLFNPGEESPVRKFQKLVRERKAREEAQRQKDEETKDSPQPDVGDMD